VHVFELVVAVAALLGAAVALRAQSRLTAVAGLGVTGYSVALVFLLFGAPDLAMTQFAVETLTVLLFVLVLYRLPPFLSRSSPRTRLRDAALALGFGTLVTLSLLSLAEQRFGSRLAPYFLEHSLPDGKGRNVVNVILVDFRSLDTLGEITVLGIAALGVAALMAAARRAP
jgi:multicomponent Na+:H+ antiporter subunit A